MTREIRRRETDAVRIAAIGTGVTYLMGAATFVITQDWRVLWGPLVWWLAR